MPKRVPSVLVVFLLFATSLAVAEPPQTGDQIFKSRCVICHGAAGEGTKKNPKPLAGDLSVLELAKVIESTMPEDDPGSCSGEDARKLAEYIHSAFYSPTARERIRPARVELSRLTVRQYQQTIADLIGDLQSDRPQTWGDERGLRGEYYRNRRIDGKNRAFERVDPAIAFDFGEGTPDAEKLTEPNEFSIRWEGSLLAPDTGDYELIVRTEHAARLWINDLEAPLIDAWVKSGSDTEFRGSLKLLGGRVYPLRLEYSKAKQGVNDRKKSDKPPPAVKSSITLLWKQPLRSVEVIPSRCLSTPQVSAGFVVGSPFPPDDRSAGYERATTVSREWDQATTEGAIEVADFIARRRESLAGVSDSTDNRDERLRTFCCRLAERAFRRPLTDRQKQFYVDRQFSEGVSPEASVKRVVLLVLKSPRFLYRHDAAASGDAYDVASRLSFALWDSLPDAELLRAAAAGELSTREQVLAQAQRMLADLRCRSKLREFFIRWLKVDQVAELSKDPQHFPEFTSELANDLRTSLDLFIDDVVWSEASDFRKLLLADTVPLNGRLAKFYGVDLPADAPFQNVPLNAELRAGVLTHPFLLASFAYNSSSSPIHRGVFISRSMLGRALRPPPEAVAPLAPELKPELTTRERVSLQTRPESCLVCHGMINPLGFSLEHFDAVGRFRSEEKGKPIDAAGTYLTRDGEPIRFQGVRELAEFLAGSEETQSAFVEQLFHYMIKQPIRAYGPDRSKSLQQTFQAENYSIRRLAAEIAAAAALP